MKEEQLLQYIQRVAQTNKNNIASLINISDDLELTDVLKKQYLQYNLLVADSADNLVARGIAPKNTGSAARLNASLLLSKKPSSSKIAHAMIRKTASDLSKSIRRVDRYNGESPKVSKLARNLCRTEESTIDALKPFL